MRRYGRTASVFEAAEPANGAVTMWLTPEDAPRSGTDGERLLARR